MYVYVHAHILPPTNIKSLLNVLYKLEHSSLYWCKYLDEKKVEMLYLTLQWNHMMVRRSVCFLVFTYLENYQDGIMMYNNYDVIVIFHNERLKVTINTNLTTTDFMDVTLDLRSGKYYPH